MYLYFTRMVNRIIYLYFTKMVNRIIYLYFTIMVNRIIYLNFTRMIIRIIYLYFTRMVNRIIYLYFTRMVNRIIYLNLSVEIQNHFKRQHLQKGVLTSFTQQKDSSKTKFMTKMTDYVSNKVQCSLPLSSVYTYFQPTLPSQTRVKKHEPYSYAKYRALVLTWFCFPPNKDSLLMHEPLKHLKYHHWILK